MASRRFPIKQQKSQSRYLSSSSVASSMEGSLKSALNSCGVSSFSSDSLFHHLSSGSGSSYDDEAVSHQSPPLLASNIIEEEEEEVEDMERTGRRMSSPNDPLVIKLASYEARGWISRSDYRYYRKLLDSEDHRHQVQTKLLEIAANKEQKVAKAPPSILHKGNSSLSRTSSSSSSDASSRHFHVSWEDQSTAQTLDKENKNKPVGPVTLTNPKHPVISNLNSRPIPENPRPPRSQAASKPFHSQAALNTATVATRPTSVLMIPSRSWRNHPPLNDQQLRKLFVEMCFFARLGFVQPSCCLQCVFSQVVARKKPILRENKTCCRWVVWRRDATEQLHPNKLDGNIVLIQCHAVQDLLEGGEVEGFAWDAPNRQLVCLQ